MATATVVAMTAAATPLPLSGPRRALILPPASPLDLLKDKLGGADAIAELTGRSSCMEPVQSNEGVTTWIKKPRTAKIPTERTAFQCDKKHIAIISMACSTGISLHAHKEDSRRRTQMLFELPYSSVAAMQQLGRTHRAGQSSAPKYVLLSSDYGPEKRFSATVAAKLTTLGAISTGDRAAHVSGQQLKLDGAAGLDAEHQSVNVKHAVATLLRDDTVTAQLDDAGFKTSDCPKVASSSTAFSLRASRRAPCSSTRSSSTSRTPSRLPSKRARPPRWCASSTSTTPTSASRRRTSSPTAAPRARSRSTMG